MYQFVQTIQPNHEGVFTNEIVGYNIVSSCESRLCVPPDLSSVKQVTGCYEIDSLSQILAIDVN